MRRTAVLAPLLILLVAPLGACQEDVTEICGLSTEAPDVQEGRGSADRDGGEALDEPADWKPGSGGSLTIGVLDFIIEKEESGSDTEGLVEDGAFPICVRLGERSEKTGAANYIDGGYVTNASHTGAVAILSNDSDLLVGRFEVELANPGGDELAFTDGVFSARLR
jgi:hypothetical protein